MTRNLGRGAAGYFFERRASRRKTFGERRLKPGGDVRVFPQGRLRCDYKKADGSLRTPSVGRRVGFSETRTGGG